jgi:Uncharacterised nucleotidyltransferase
MPSAEPLPPIPGLSGLAAILSMADGRPVATVPDWPATVALAIRHALGPAVFRRVQRADGEWRVPPDLLRALREVYVGSAFASQRLHADAAAALDALTRAGVEAIALKGLHLATAYYAEPALRPMKDIDLLVRGEQTRAAWDALCACGYAGVEHGTEYRELRLSHHLPRMVKPGAAPIELHRTLAAPSRPLRIDLDLLRVRSRPIPVGARTVAAFAPEDLLLHLCIHAAEHHLCLVPLRNVYDLALVVQGPPPLDWDRVTTAAGAFGARRAVFCGLLLAREVFGAEVPGSVLGRLVPGADRSAVLRLALAAVIRCETPPADWLVSVAGGRTALHRAGKALGRAFAEPVPPDGAGRAAFPGRTRVYLRRLVDRFIRYRRLLVQLALSRPAARAQLRAARAAASVEGWLSTPEGPSTVQ